MFDSASGPVARGGPQIIMRPKRWQSGGPSPWAHLADRRLSIDRVVAAISGRVPTGTGGSTPVGTEQKSAVLVGLYDERNPCVILTRRSRTMRSHTHEVSFPGGRVDSTDGTLWDTACREASEEMALNTSHLQFLGCLDPRITIGSHSIIHPFVAVLPSRPDLTPNPDEVETIRHVPLADLLEDDAWREERWDTSLGSVTITFFELDGDTVWGATAAMLRQLLVLSLGVTDENRY